MPSLPPARPPASARRSSPRRGDRYSGKGVLRAVANVNDDIADAIGGLDVLDERAIDHTMIDLDGTPDKGSLGATRAGRLPGLRQGAGRRPRDPALPGHRRRRRPRSPRADAQRAERRCPRQELDRLPGFHAHARSAASFSEALRWGTETYHMLRAVLTERGLPTAVGDEGGLAPDLPSNEDAVTPLLEALSGRDACRARRSRSVSTPPPASCGTTGCTCSPARDGHCRPPSWSTTGWTSLPLPDRLH